MKGQEMGAAPNHGYSRAQSFKSTSHQYISRSRYVTKSISYRKKKQL